MRYAVFLRAINLGKHNKMLMLELKTWLTEMGCCNIETYLQTGNIMLETTKPAEEFAIQLETTLLEKHYKDVSVFVRDQQQIQSLLETQPFKTPLETHQEYITLLRHPSAFVLPQSANGLEVVQRDPLTVFTRLEKHPDATAPNAWIERHTKTKATSRFWRVMAVFLQKF